MMNKRIGVLAIQGAFIEHINVLKALKIDCIEIRKEEDLDLSMDGLILPGGESTVMGKLLHELNLFIPLKKQISEGLPVFGTCAGLILLSKSISNDENTYFAAMDIETRRNAYGRQLGSFNINSNFTGIGEVPMTFIRAPIIEKVWDDVEILGQVNDKIIAARQRNMLVTAFHPELTCDTRIHRYFLNML